MEVGPSINQALWTMTNIPPKRDNMLNHCSYHNSDNADDGNDDDNDDHDHDHKNINSSNNTRNGNKKKKKNNITITRCG